MCVLSIKVSIRKKSGNLFNDPRINGYCRREMEWSKLIVIHFALIFLGKI